MIESTRLWKSGEPINYILMTVGTGSAVRICCLENGGGISFEWDSIKFSSFYRIHMYLTYYLVSELVMLLIMYVQCHEK